MSELLPQDLPSKKTAWPWLALAVAGILFLFTAIGVFAGGCIAWMNLPPPPPHTNEYSGLNELVALVAHLAGGLLLGGVAGCLTGIVASVMVVRRLKPAGAPRSSN